MGYKSRQKKREVANKKRAASIKEHAAAKTRQKHIDVVKHRWYLTFVKHKTCCARCAGILKVGMEMVYRHTPREALCKRCAEADPSLKPRPSAEWEKRRLAGRKTLTSASGPTTAGHLGTTSTPTRKAA